MKIRLFVTSSAVVLTVWLGITFFREVPREKYPQLGRGSLPISAKAETDEPNQVTASLKKKPEEPVASLR